MNTGLRVSLVESNKAFADNAAAEMQLDRALCALCPIPEASRTTNSHLERQFVTKSTFERPCGPGLHVWHALRSNEMKAPNQQKLYIEQQIKQKNMISTKFSRTEKN